MYVWFINGHKIQSQVIYNYLFEHEHKHADKSTWFSAGHRSVGWGRSSSLKATGAYA